MDNLSIRAVEEKFHKGLPKEAGAILITEVDGNLPEEIDYQICKIEEKFFENGASEFVKANNEQEAADLWFARKTQVLALPFMEVKN